MKEHGLSHAGIRFTVLGILLQKGLVEKLGREAQEYSRNVIGIHGPRLGEFLLYSWSSPILGSPSESLLLAFPKDRSPTWTVCKTVAFGGFCLCLRASNLHTCMVQLTLHACKEKLLWALRYVNGTYFGGSGLKGITKLGYLGLLEGRIRVGIKFRVGIIGYKVGLGLVQGFYVRDRNWGFG